MSGKGSAVHRHLCFLVRRSMQVCEGAAGALPTFTLEHWELRPEGESQSHASLQPLAQASSLSRTPTQNKPRAHHTPNPPKTCVHTIKLGAL